MATVTKSIGTSSRDYSTITLWEADLDNGAEYSASDDAVGELYNDSVFDEEVDIASGETIGLSSITLSVVSADRHDGTAGSGARIVPSSSLTNAFVINLGDSTPEKIMEWVEVDMSSSGPSGGSNNSVLRIDSSQGSGDGLVTVKNCIVHDFASTNSRPVGIGVDALSSCRKMLIMNNIVYDIAITHADRPAYGISGQRSSLAGVASNVLNNTAHNVTTSGTGDGNGIFIEQDRSSETFTVKNNISTDSGDEDFIFQQDAGTIDNDYNMSSDATATGTNSVASVTTADQYVSTTGGSEDLHLKSGSDAIDAGLDLVTTPSGVEIDINGRDRDSNGDTWDIGAHEFVSGGGGDTFTSQVTLTGAGVRKVS